MTPTAFAQTTVGRGVEERAQTAREETAEKSYAEKSYDGQKDTKQRVYQTPNWSVVFFRRPLRARALKIAL